MSKMKTNTRCRICRSGRLTKVIDFGVMPLANAYLSKDVLNKAEQRYPLRVFSCQDCGLYQLLDIVSPEVLFRDYVYFSSGMPALPEHFRKYAEEVMYKFITSKDNLIVEIGSNDGLFLGAMKDCVRILGVDPAVEIAKIANDRGVETLPEFFNEKLAKEIAKKYGQASVIIGNNVVAHINDYHDLVNGIKTLLVDDGVFILEAPYLLDMFENLSFDTIYHEHLSYLAVGPLKRLFEQYGMEIFDVKIYPVQGNSLRVFVGKKGRHRLSRSIKELLQREDATKLRSRITHIEFRRKIEATKHKVVDLVKNLRKDGKSIAGYGAPAKGNTLLNFYGIGKDILDYVTEELPSKIGLYTPGTHLPIVDIKDARKNPPDYFLLLAWNYKDSILQKEKEFLRNGGEFVMPIGNIGIV